MYIYTHMIWSYMYALLRDLRPDLLNFCCKRLNALTFHRGMQRLGFCISCICCSNVPTLESKGVPLSTSMACFGNCERIQRRWPSAPYHPKGCQCECWQVAACYFLGVHQGWKKSWCCWERHRVRQRSCPAFSPLETSHTLESPWFKRWKLCDHTMGLFDMGDGMNRLVVRCTLCVPLAVDFVP